MLAGWYEKGGLAEKVIEVGDMEIPRAGPGEVLVSSTVKDLVAGSGLAFEDRGQHELKGIPGAWHLYAVQRWRRVNHGWS